MPPESNIVKVQPDSEKHDSNLQDFGNSLINSAIQNPVNSLSQIGSEISGVKLPQLHYFDPAPSSDGTQSFASQAGNVVGMIVPFMVAHRAVGIGASKLNIEFSGSVMSRAAEQAATGAVMGMALTPTDEGFTGRLRNGIIDAGTFGVMGAAGAKLTSTFNTPGELSLSSRIVRSSLVGVGSGIPGGFVHSELHSLVNKGEFASAADVRNDVASFALLGGIFGGIEGLRRNKEVSAPSEIKQRFPVYAESQLKIGRDAVRNELAQVKASAPEGQTMSVLDKFDQSNLSIAQKERVLDALAAVRENHVSTRLKDGKIDPDQEKNWIHTQGEFGRNIDSAQRMKLTPEQTEDTLIGSMFSDAVKSKSNFMVHHRDGREAAVTFLSTMKGERLSPERIEGIGNMILEHQIGPPVFMKMIYANSIIADINLQRTAEYASLKGKPTAELTSAEQQSLNTLESLSRAYERRFERLASPIEHDPERVALAVRQGYGRFVADEEVVAIQSLGQKIANPLGQPVIDTESGAKAIYLTDMERSLLRRTGNDQWYVPDESTPWYSASRSLINADSIDNYATPGGFSKLVGMNGPETDIFFRDKTIQETLASPRRSFNSAYEIMSPEGKQLANAELAKTDQAIERAMGRTENWLRQELNVPNSESLPNVPYWNSNLAYPERGAGENAWWKLHKKAERTPQEEAQWQQERFTGLSAQQIDQFLFAKRIRDHMVDELRREQRVDGSLPPDFQPVMRRAPLQHAE